MGWPPWRGDGGQRALTKMLVQPSQVISFDRICITAAVYLQGDCQLLIIGCHFSEEMVNPYVDIVCLACDCACLPIDDGCIDMVVSGFGFESMQSKMMDGFREGYRVLKPRGHVVYNISIVGDHNSENTKKWERLYRSLDESFSLHDKLFDIVEWEDICRNTGYVSTEIREVYGELPAPEGDVFPFENEILQWMGEYLCVSEK